MKHNYVKSLTFTLRFEGGWSNHPQDPGGATMKGVIQRVYDGYRQRRGLPKQSVRYIQERELQEIYRKQYWDAVKGDLLPAGVDLAVFDFGVNSGPVRAIKYLQIAAGCKKIDGNLGEATLDAIKQADPVELAKKVNDLRMRFLRSLSTFKTFGKGWSSRVASCRAVSVRMATEAVPMVDKITPVPEDSMEEVSQVSPKAEEEAPKSNGLLNTVIGFFATAGTTVTAFFSEVPVPVALTIIGIGAVAGIAYWYFNYYKKREEI